jgi:hypothetical protein
VYDRLVIGGNTVNGLIRNEHEFSAPSERRVWHRWSSSPLWMPSARRVRAEGDGPNSSDRRPPVSNRYQRVYC